MTGQSTAGQAMPHRAHASVDILQRVTQQMLKHQVAGLPRNYELFHEAMFGHDPALARQLTSLGPHPAQAALDQLGLKFGLTSHCGLREEKTQREAVQVLQDLCALLSAGILHKQTFGRALETVVREIREDESRGLNDILAELDFLDGSASELVRAEAELSVKLKEGLARIAAADQAASNAKAASLRDRLTGLPNRIAFFNRLDTLYGAAEDPRDTALVIASVDQFRAICHSYGEDAGAKLLKRLAAIFRKTIKKNDFVARIGPEEFAFLFDEVNEEAMRTIAERLHAAVADNLVFATEDGGDNGNLLVSIGFALCQDTISAAQLVSHAETALAAARANHRMPVAGFAIDHGRGPGRRVA